jgi:uncharacterized protein YebE (UPF0316 family)
MKKSISYRNTEKKYNLPNQKRKQLLYLTSLILAIGGISCILGLLLLIFNFNQIDNMIAVALPFMIGGIVLFLLYYGLDFHYGLSKIRSDFFKALFR